MTKLLFALLFSMLALGCSKTTNNSVPVGIIQASQVPPSVMASYNTRYPAATGQVEWEKEDGNTYKVKFYLGTQRWQARFTADGTFLGEQQI